MEYYVLPETGNTCLVLHISKSLGFQGPEEEWVVLTSMGYL